jgi:hypothetical protein
MQLPSTTNTHHSGRTPYLGGGNTVIRADRAVMADTGGA